MIRSRRLNRRLALLLSALMLSPSSALANPLGAQVVGGQASIQGQGTNSVTVTQGTNNAIINWNTFNIGAGEKTQFVQPSASSIALNRVIGGLGASEIFGSLTANGRIFLVNPNGVLIGQGAVINASGFLATTHDISNADFMAGRYNFNIPGRPDASIVNLGNITITPSSSGFAALVAPGVRNAGVITADLGRVALASGNGFTLDFYGDKLITLQVNDQIAGQVIDVATKQPLKSLVSNEGRLQANGGQVALTAVAARAVVDSVINNSGVIEANSVGTKNGMIVLGAATAGTKGAGAPTQTVKISGTLSAKGSNKGEKGGTIQVTGEAIELTGAKLDASGDAGGGTVLIGGDTGGGVVNPAVSGISQAQLQPWAVPTASAVSIDATSVIDASATTTGNGGKVVVWSDQSTSFAGQIKATGGVLGGNGGFVEVSSKGLLNYTGLANLSAPNGQFGTLLLDPYNLTICSQCTGEEQNGSTLNGQTFTPDGPDSKLDVADLVNALTGANVIVTTGSEGVQKGNITVTTEVNWSGKSTLTLDAAHNIDVRAPITAADGGLALIAGHNIKVGGAIDVVTLTVNAGNRIKATGAVNVGTFVLQSGYWKQVASQRHSEDSEFTRPLPDFSATDFRLQGGTFLRATGGRGTSRSPYQIVDVYGLQGIGSPSGALLDKDFVLASNIDASGTSKWNNGAGFVPIGTAGNPFTGTFDGRHYVYNDDHELSEGFSTALSINNLTIAPVDPNITSIGLFGANAGTIQNVNLENASIAANANPNVTSQFVGTLAGQNFGTISNVSVAGIVDGRQSAGVVAGGLVGFNLGSLGGSSTSGDVTVGSSGIAGGLVGLNLGAISYSRAGGEGSAVTGGDNSIAGGLVGVNFLGTLDHTRASGGVAVGNGIPCSDEGCGGFGFGVGGMSFAGGLVGINLGDISYSSSRANVTVGSNAFGGGLVGVNGLPFDFGPIGFANANVSGVPTFGSIATSHASGVVSSTGINVTLGGLVGLNTGDVEDSHSRGNVSATAASNGSSGCSFGTSCVGGLVGWNDGTIRKSSAGGQGDEEWTTVSVGSQGIAGGLVGFNDINGRIWKSHAAVKVTGDPGAPSDQDVFNKVTVLGGLVGQNQGFIGRSSATGAVGGTGDFLEVGGLVAKNNGTIWRSSATGDVTAGNFSSAGGLVAENNPGGQNCEGECGPAGPAKISHSSATGNVKVGSDSIAGGLVAINQGTISHTRAGTAESTVAGGDNSILGGLVAVNDLSGVIKNSSASGAVDSLGPNSPNSLNSVLGGFVGVNGGSIDNSQTAAAVAGTSNSYVGGFVGVNIGSIIDSHVVDAASVTVSGGGNFVGGFVGMNIGLIDPSTTVVTPQTQPGTNNIVGGFAGANFDFANFTFPAGVQVPSFPTGQILNSTTTDSVHPFIGTDAVTSGPSTPPPPAPPSILNQCSDPLCAIIIALPLTTSQPTPPPGPTPPGPTPPTCNDPSCQPTTTPPSSPLNTPPVVQIAPPNLFTNNNQLTLINLTTGGTGGTGGAGNGNGGNGGQNGNRSPGPPPGPGLGRTLSEQQFSGVPPIGETRFLPGQIVMQISDTVSLADVQKIAAQFGITLISSQNIPGRVLYSFSFATDKDIRRLILALEHNNLVASVQPNYVFGLTQGATAPAAPAVPRDQSPPPAGDTTGSIPPPTEAAPDLANSNTAALESLPVGDAAQYVIGKLHLGDVHRLARGRNVSVAVIDSEIDARHPDLAGVLAERYDATQSASRPHAHGTGMAGAIASHTRLLGVAPGVRLLAIKAFDEAASTAEATSFQILKGLDYAIAKNVRIINMSFAGPRDPMMERTLKTAHDKGVILIAAAGNAGPKSPPLYPGADPSVIAVTATDYTDKPFSMANRGKYVAIAAPGVDVMVPAPGNTYQLTTGTSVAAAHVSGVAALLVERKPTITPDEVRAVLMRTARAFAALPKGELDGAGLIDPVGALQAVALGRSSEASPPARSATAH